MYLKKNNVFFKIWYFLRTYILILKFFDLILQGSFLIVILLESNVYLLLRRDQNEGHNPSFIQDWVMIGAGGIEFLFGTFLAWIGRGKRQLALSSWLAVTSAAGLLVLAFPFAESNPANVELCGGQTVSQFSNSVDTNIKPRTVILIIAALLCSLTKVSVWSHGLTYLDDHQPNNGPYFYGILISIRLSLGLSGSGWLQASSLTEDWWVPHISISMLTLMFAVLFPLFPTRMPQWQDEAVIVSTDYIASVVRVAKNKTVILQTVALAFLSTAVFGFIHYEESYVQARFHLEAIRQDPRTSRLVSDIFRPLVVIFFVMIFRVRFSDRRSDGVKANTASRVGGVVALFVAAFLAALAGLSCQTQEVLGFGEEGLQSDCSLHCGCNSGRYGFSPVCGLDSQTTFFSPCTAGCSEYEDLNGFVLFQNCSCGMQRVVRGACTLQDCRVIYSIYQVIYTLILAVSGASFLMQGMVLIRTVERVDKPVAMAFSIAGVGLLAFVIGHLSYMLISSLTCSITGGDGECLLHKQSLWIMLVVSIVLAVLSAVTSIIASFMKKEVIPTTEL